MADRYQRVFISNDKYYLKGCPILITAYAILKDNSAEKILAQIKLQNISNNTIIACKVNIRAYEVNGAEVEGVSDFSYLDLDVKPYVEFGTKTPIYLAGSTARKITVSVIEVVYKDGTVWKAEPCEWERIPKQEPLSVFFSSNDLKRQYELEVGGNCLYVPILHDELFLCTCGAVSHVSYGRCYKCKREYNSLEAVLDEDILREKRYARLKKEEEKKRADEEAAAIAAEKERIAREKAQVLLEQKKKKRSRRLKIFTVLAALIIIIGIFAVTEVRRTQAVCDEYLRVLDQRTEAIIDDQFSRQCQLTDISYEVSNLKRAGLGKTFRASVNLDCSSKNFHETSEDDFIKMIKKYIPGEVELPSGYKVILTKGNSPKDNPQQEMLTITVNGKALSWSDTSIIDESASSTSAVVEGRSPEDYISVGDFFTVGLLDDGTVVTAGASVFGQCDVSEWSDIIAVAAGGFHTVGLKSDGTVLAVGQNDNGQCNVSGWKNIEKVFAGKSVTAGINSKGTVVIAGNNKYGQCNVSDWSDIKKVAIGSCHTVGLKNDGSVIATGKNGSGECEVSEWNDIVDIAAGDNFTVGLKSDGTVVATGVNGFGQCDVAEWRDIIQISAGLRFTVGLKNDGSVVVTDPEPPKAAGLAKNDLGQANVSDWNNVIAVSAGAYHTVGLKEDGSVVSTKVLAGDDQSLGQDDTDGWIVKTR